MSTPTALRELFRRALTAPSPLAQQRPAPARRLVDDGLVFFAGPGGAADNNVLVLRPVELDELHRKASRCFGGASFSIEIESDVCSELERELLRLGWAVQEEEPALALAPLPGAVPGAPPQLVIRPVHDERELADYRAVSATPDWIVPSLAAATDPGVAVFVGYVNEQPVATARMEVLDGVTEITGVETDPGHRRRGFGTAMTWAAISEGARRGCMGAVLTASPLGYPVYIAMGFVPISTFRTYVRRSGV